MKIDVALLPTDLNPERLAGRCAIVFDVLRATTTIAAALAAGVTEIRLFQELDDARAAAAQRETASPVINAMPKQTEGARAGTARCEIALLCGEERCLTPAGFHLGNSPGQFRNEHRDATLLMCTTNGTRALLACRAASVIFTAALVNAAAAARAALSVQRDVILVCAGTNGALALEDLLAAGAVIDSIAATTHADLESDTAIMADELFQSCRNRLPAILRTTIGGKNIRAAQLHADIDFAAQLNTIDAVGIASGNPFTVRRFA